MPSRPLCHCASLFHLGVRGPPLPLVIPRLLSSALPARSMLARSVRLNRSSPEVRIRRRSSRDRSLAPPRGMRLLGPAPAAMARRADRFHAQLLVESDDRATLHRFLDAWLPRAEGLPGARRVRWALDVDPLELF